MPVIRLWRRNWVDQAAATLTIAVSISTVGFAIRIVSAPSTVSG